MEKRCGCKGIRSCLLCETDNNSLQSNENQGKVNHYLFCDLCGSAWTEDGGSNSNHPHHLGVMAEVDFSGIHVVHEFITEEEENELCTEIDRTSWTDSQSGRRKQDYGPKVNFKKQKLKLSVFSGLPYFSEKLVQRFQTVGCLKEFIPVELCNLDYAPDRGSAIDPHFDDFWLWGERLVTLNLLSDTVLTFTSDKDIKVEISVLLPRRSLIVVSGDARYCWKHAIHRSHVTSRRLAMTFRELTPEFLPGGQREEVGKEVTEIALSFKGTAVGVL